VTSRRPRDRLFLIGYAVILVGFLFARVEIFQLDGDQAFADTVGYLRVAELGLTEAGFLAGERPFTVPLIYKAVGLETGDPLDPQAMRRATNFQLGFSVAAWVSLAAVVAWASHGRWNRLAGFGLVLAFGTSLDVAQWDRVLLSESVSASLFAVLVGASISGIQLWRPQAGGPGWPWQIVFVAGSSLLAVLFAFTRDTNGYLVLAASILLAGSLAVPAVRTRQAAPIAAILAIAFAFTFYFQDRSAILGKRWLGPFLNVFSARILPVGEFVGYFSDRGFPEHAITEEMYLGRSVFLSQLDQGQAGDQILEWIELHGRSVYLEFLASRPAQSLGKPILRAGSMVNVDSSEYRLQERPDPAWAVLISRLMFPGHVELLIVIALVSSAVMLPRTNRGQALPFIATGFALLLLSYPLAVVIWHADTIELERHSYQLALQLRLAAWLLLLSALPSVVELARRKPRPSLVGHTSR